MNEEKKQNEAKELLQEILVLMDVNANVDDLFYFGVFFKDDRYAEKLLVDGWANNWPPAWDIKTLKIDIMKGETLKPDWMTEVEEGDGDGYLLHILPKDSQFQPLIDKMLRFLRFLDRF